MSIKSSLRRIILGRTWIKEQSQENRDYFLARAEAKRERKKLKKRNHK